MYSDEWLERMKLCGANPNLRNYEKKTPAECARSPDEMAAQIRKIFGDDDEKRRSDLIKSAIRGDVSFSILEQRPYLINTQDD